MDTKLRLFISLFLNNTYRITHKKNQHLSYKDNAGFYKSVLNQTMMFLLIIQGFKRIGMFKF